MFKYSNVGIPRRARTSKTKYSERLQTVIIMMNFQKKIFTAHLTISRRVLMACHLLDASFCTFLVIVPVIRQRGEGGVLVVPKKFRFSVKYNRLKITDFIFLWFQCKSEEKKYFYRTRDHLQLVAVSFYTKKEFHTFGLDLAEQSSFTRVIF